MVDFKETFFAENKTLNRTRDACNFSYMYICVLMQSHFILVRVHIFMHKVLICNSTKLLKFIANKRAFNVDNCLSDQSWCILKAEPQSTIAVSNQKKMRRNEQLWKHNKNMRWKHRGILTWKFYSYKSGLCSCYQCNFPYCLKFLYLWSFLPTNGLS